MNFVTANLPPNALTALAEASATINSTLDLETVLNQIAESAAAVMQAEASSVLTLEKRRDKLIFAAAAGERGKQLVGKEFDANLGIAGHVVRTGKSENIANVGDNPDFFRGIDEQHRFHTRGLMAAPMVFKDEVIGVVEVLNRKDGTEFPESERPLLELFANLAACSTRNAITHADLAKQRNAFRDSVLAGMEIVGSSRGLKETIRLADRVAPTNATALLTGETGTGKEVLAKYIHNASARADKAFIAVNCAALPEALLESELFGHEKGAFTGAIAQRTGRFELADNGTLFLDEIGEISAAIQVKLLRVLQEKAFTRVGGAQTKYSDVRIIAATNRDLKKAISDGLFRDDLFYRLNVFPLTVPPLRNRRTDIPDLAAHFCKSAAIDLRVAPHTISSDAYDALARYAWPGNIRELANVIERAVLLCDGPVILPCHLPPEISASASPGSPPVTTLRGSEREMIVHALKEHFWNQSKAARSLGISRDNLRYRIKKYAITRGD